MPLTRREAIQVSAGAAAALVNVRSIAQLAAQPVTAASAVRQKLEMFATNATLVAALKQGVATMKSRKPSDPKSWFYQAAIHGVTAEAVAEASNSDPEVAHVDQDKFWNRCPHFDELNASSADFLIWHRAYLYYFERILREAADEPQLALPYWNYLDANQLTFPALLADPDEDDDGKPRNPLFDARRENAFTLGVLELNPAAVNADRAFAEKRFFGDLANRGFAGAVDEGEPASQGLIERNPHNLVHFAIGGAIGTDPDGAGEVGGLMSNVPTAAFDPIFWIHHCNIDRLWSVWECLPERVWGFPPAAQWFAEKPWFFHDVDGTVKNEPRSHYFQQRNLNLSFDSDVAGAARLSDALPTGGSRLQLAARVRRATEADAEPNERVAAAAGAVELTPAQPSATTINLASIKPFGAPTLRAALAEPAQRETRRALLFMEGVDYSGTPSASYEVHVNVPAGQQPDVASKNFLGVLGLFGTKHTADRQKGHGESEHGDADADAAHHAHVEVFDVSEIIAQGPEEQSDLRVVFVPTPLLRMKAKNAIVRPAARKAEVVERVSIQAVKLVALETQA